MSRHEVNDHITFRLPPAIVSKVDVSRLAQEFEQVDNALTAKAVHEKTGVSGRETPAMSPQLSAFLDANPLDLDDATARTAWVKQLKLLKNNVHVMNMTFAAPADTESLQQLVAWARETVDPQLVIDAHLQPSLVAGVYIRSQNQVFDFTIRNALKERRGELKKSLEALRG